VDTAGSSSGWSVLLKDTWNRQPPETDLLTTESPREVVEKVIKLFIWSFLSDPKLLAR